MTMYNSLTGAGVDNPCSAVDKASPVCDCYHLVNIRGNITECVCNRCLLFLFPRSIVEDVLVIVAPDGFSFGHSVSDTED